MRIHIKWEYYTLGSVFLEIKLMLGSLSSTMELVLSDAPYMPSIQLEYCCYRVVYDVRYDKIMHTWYLVILR